MSGDWDEYVERVRSWFIDKILIPLTRDIQQVDAQMETSGLGHLSARFPATYSMAAKAADAKDDSTIGGGGGGITSTGSTSAGHYFLGGMVGVNKISSTLMDLVQSRGSADPLVKARLRIEKYLSTAPTTAQRLALIKRISALSQGNSIHSEQDDLQVKQATTSMILILIIEHFRSCYICFVLLWMKCYPRRMPTTLSPSHQLTLFQLAKRPAPAVTPFKFNKLPVNQFVLN
jgi:hypothetical protein